MADELQEILEAMGSKWEVVDDCAIMCPCGEQMEWDNPRCSECGKRNPVVALGFI